MCLTLLYAGCSWWKKAVWMARLHTRGFFWYTAQQFLRLYILLVRTLDLWALSGKGKRKAGKCISMWDHWSGCMMSNPFSNCSDSQIMYAKPWFPWGRCSFGSSLWGPSADPQRAIMDRNNFAAICPWKGFSTGIDVLSFKKQDF